MNLAGTQVLVCHIGDPLLSLFVSNNYTVFMTKTKTARIIIDAGGVGMNYGVILK